MSEFNINTDYNDVSISIELSEPVVDITIGGTGHDIGSALPPVTDSDNGKIMTVVDGEWKAEEITISADGSAVQSVNGKIGKVVLTAEDVGALPANTEIPTVPENVSAFVNDAGYLTEHQDISGKLDADKLPEAIDDALEQAKASGEFKGEPGAKGEDGKAGADGKDGANGEDGKDGKDGVSPVVDVEPISGGHKVTITDVNGSQSFQVMNGIDGSGGDGSGDMLKAVYDANNNGIVDNAEKLDGKTADYFAKAAHDHPEYATGDHEHDEYLTEETDPTVPSWAKADKKPTYTAEEVGAAEKEHTHPQYITEFIEKDPTVPAWAKAEKKPTYTAEEIGAAEKEHTHPQYITEFVEKDPTVPEWAKAENKPAYTAEEVGAAEKEHTHPQYLTEFVEEDPTVPAWAKQPNKPTYTAAEVGLGNVDNVKQYSVSNPPPYPVTSVNGQTGDVVIEGGGSGGTSTIETIKRTLLWENPTPNDAVPDADVIVNLASDNYDELEIFYKAASTSTTFLCQKTLKGKSTQLASLQYPTGGPQLSYRSFTWLSDTQYKYAGSSSGFNKDGNVFNNGWNIPFCIYGVKKINQAIFGTAVTYGTDDLTAGTSELADGEVYLMYE